MNQTMLLPHPIDVSVIIPCYNYARFLPNAVASVVEQTFTSWELIIVDDGSSDATLDTTKYLIADYPKHRIRLLHQPNQGASAARNTGARYAVGEYIMFLDADDMLAPTYLQSTTAVLREQPAVGFVYTGLRFFGRDRHKWPSVSFDLQLLLLEDFVPSHALMRRVALEQVGGYDTVHFPKGCEDWDFWLRVAVAGWRGWHIDELLVLYRRHETSMTHNFKSEYDWDARAQIIRKHPNLYGRRLAAWATARCAHRSLPSASQSRFDRSEAHEQQLVAEFALSELRPVLSSEASPAEIPLMRRLIRVVPFRVRFAVRCWMRRTQLALRAAAPWLY